MHASRFGEQWQAVRGLSMPKLEASRVFPGTVSIVVCVCVSCVHLLLVYLDNLYLYVYANMRTCTGPRRVFAGRPSRVPGMCLQLRVHVRVRAGLCGSEREIERERERERVCVHVLLVCVCVCMHTQCTHSVAPRACTYRHTEFTHTGERCAGTASASGAGPRLCSPHRKVCLVS